MPNCSHCSAVLAEGEKFCRKCGERVQPERETRFCAVCGKPNGLAAKFCKSCGEPLPPVAPPAVASPGGADPGTGSSGNIPSSPDAPVEPRCPHCGVAVKAGARFCKSCGQSLGAFPEQDAHEALSPQPVTGTTRPAARSVETFDGGEPEAGLEEERDSSILESFAPPEETPKPSSRPTGRGRRIAQVVVVCCALAGVGVGSFFYFRNREEAAAPSDVANGTDNGTAVNATLPIPPDNGTASGVTPPIPPDNGTASGVTPPIPPDNGASGARHKSSKDQGGHGKHSGHSGKRQPPEPQPSKPQPVKPTPEEKKIHDQLIEMKKSLS